MLQVQDLQVTYPTPQGKAYAVNGINLEVAAGETVGIVGESGCGKSSLARAVMRLLEASAVRIVIGDVDVTSLPKRKPRPDIIVLDEPVSTLDVSLQAQVLNLLVDLQQQYRMAYLFVSHDIGVVQHMADRIAVMYLGRIVEIAPYADIMESPQHPYTQALLQAIPVMDPRRLRIADKQILIGNVPSPLTIPSGCAFHTRCRFATDRCRHSVPPLHSVGSDSLVACHLSAPSTKSP